MKSHVAACYWWKSEIVNDIHFSNELGACDHLAYSAYLLPVCNSEINDSEALEYNFIKVTMIQFTRNFSQVIETIEQYECLRKLGFFPGEANLDLHCLSKRLQNISAKDESR